MVITMDTRGATGTVTDTATMTIARRPSKVAMITRSLPRRTLRRPHQATPGRCHSPRVKIARSEEGRANVRENAGPVQTGDRRSAPRRSVRSGGQDAKSVNSSTIEGTEDEVWCRPVRSGGRDSVLQQLPSPASCAPSRSWPAGSPPSRRRARPRFEGRSRRR
jgi:hypothetical protein